MGKIAELSSSVDNTVLYPLTKTKAVTNDEDVVLDTLLSDETEARILGDQRLSDRIDAIDPSASTYEHLSVEDETIVITIVSNGG